MKLPPYDIFPTVHGDDISLVEIQTSFIEDLVTISFYDAVQATTLQQAKEMHAKINRDYNEGTSIHWGILDHRKNKMVGTCGYYRGFDHGTGELGCVLLPPYRGQGFMTAAMWLAIDFGLSSIGLNRIIALTSPQNVKAVKLLERLYFIKMADLNDGGVEYELKQDFLNCSGFLKK